MIYRHDSAGHDEVVRRLEEGECRFPVVDEAGEEVGYVVSTLEVREERTDEPVTIDASTREVWEQKVQLEFRDQDGNVVGFFVRHGPSEREAEAEAMGFFTEEMLNEASRSGGRPLADIFRDLDVA